MPLSEATLQLSFFLEFLSSIELVSSSLLMDPSSQTGLSTVRLLGLGAFSF